MGDDGDERVWSIQVAEEAQQEGEEAPHMMVDEQEDGAVPLEECAHMDVEYVLEGRANAADGNDNESEKDSGDKADATSKLPVSDSVMLPHV